MYSIYCLIDLSGKIFYIGCSKKVDRRVGQHMDRFGKIDYSILEENIPDDAQARKREKHWIAFYWDKFSLVNKKAPR